MRIFPLGTDGLNGLCAQKMYSPTRTFVEDGHSFLVDVYFCEVWLARLILGISTVLVV